MTNSDRKGKVGEREWAAKLSAAGFEARRGQQHAGGPDSPDVICPDLDPLLHPEVKRVERLNIHDAVQQAVRDAAPGKLVYVAHRRNGQDWLVTMPADHWLRLLGESRTW